MEGVDERMDDAPVSDHMPGGSSSRRSTWTDFNDGWYPDSVYSHFASHPSSEDYIASLPPGNAIITYPGDDGRDSSLQHINIAHIAERSPLIATAFESCHSGQRLHLEVLTDLCAVPFLAFLYGTSISEDVPTSLLLHCQLYRLGVIYDIGELKKHAYVNVLRQCEFGCSSPDKPIDLCAAIRFAYGHLREHEEVTDAIVNYCVTQFLAHGLEKDADFAEMSFDLRPFHQDLVRVCRNAGFEHESAMAIIRMPYRNHVPEGIESAERWDHAGNKLSFTIVKAEPSVKVKKYEPCFEDELPARRNKSEQTSFKSKELILPRPVPQVDALTRMFQPQASWPKPDSGDSDYELVAGPSAVYTSDSDSDALVDARVTTLPIRRVRFADRADTAEAAEFDSDGWEHI